MKAVAHGFVGKIGRLGRNRFDRWIRSATPNETAGIRYRERSAGGREEMPSFFDSGPLPDFKEIRKWLGNDFPWKMAEQWERDNDNSWLNQFIRGVMDNANQWVQAERKGWLQTETKKDEKHVVVSIALPSDAEQRDLRLFATSDRLKIFGLPSDRKQIVRFPCLVLPRSGRVSRKNNRLIVKFRRRPAGRDEVELFIRP
jgi:hypothetical protein